MSLSTDFSCDDDNSQTQTFANRSGMSCTDDAYVAEPKDKDTEHGIILFPDFMGYELINVKLCAILSRTHIHCSIELIVGKQHCGSIRRKRLPLRGARYLGRRQRAPQLGTEQRLQPACMDGKAWAGQGCADR